MKRLLLSGMALAAFLFFVPGTHAQNVGINAHGTPPDASAMLDIASADKGLLVPRVSLVSTSDKETIPSPATSLLVYNTNGAIAGMGAGGAGFYYNEGTPEAPVWVKMQPGGVRWDDLRVELDKGTDPALFRSLKHSDYQGPEMWFFRGNIQDKVDAMSFTVQLPHAWKEGTTIYPHLHWIPEPGSGSIEWNLDYSWVSYDKTNPQKFPKVQTSTVVFTVNPSDEYTHQITPLTPDNEGLDGAGHTVSSILICRLWRNSRAEKDLYTGDAGLLYVDFHILVDGLGSRQEYVK